MTRSILGLMAAAFASAQSLSGADPAANPLANLKTKPERTNYEQTSRYDDVVAFLDGSRAGGAELVHLTTFGYTFEGRALPLAVVGAPTPRRRP